MKRHWMLYGANGYTGRLLVAEAAKRGLKPVLAGRSRDKIASLAAETGFEHRVFPLDDPNAVQRALDGIGLVLHCAGPFSATSQAMIEGCLASGCHYLDISGEISVFENAYRQHEPARRADIVLLPGTGFDVVPTDCLAASLIGLLPAATRLTLAFASDGGLSPGTAKTSLEGLARGGCIRRDGRLKRVPLAWKTREIPFADGPRLAVTIPWGDVFTAYVSTGVPDIEVYMAAPPRLVKRLRQLRLVQPLLRLRWLQDRLKRRIGQTVKGPSADERLRGTMQLWGEAGSADGRTATATMTTPNGYDVTVSASLGIVEHLLSHDVEGGYYTPSLLMGEAYAMHLPGVSWQAV